MSSRYAHNRSRKLKVQVSIADMEPTRKNEAVAALYAAAWSHVEKVAEESEVVFAGTLVADWESYDRDTNYGGCFTLAEVKDVVILIDGVECKAEDHAPLHALIGVFESLCETITKDLEDDRR